MKSFLLKNSIGVIGVPTLFNFSKINNDNILVQRIFCRSIDILHWHCNNKFSEMTVLLIARDLISIPKEVHKKVILNKDLKPGNICYDSFHDNNKKLLSTINIVDFGLAEKFSYENLRKNNSKNYQYFVGTPIFASSAALSGIAQHPKDELESIFYILIYLKSGQLPWVKNQNNNNNKNIYLNEILMMHKNTPLSVLFDGFCHDVPFLFKTIKNLMISLIMICKFK